MISLMIMKKTFIHYILSPEFGNWYLGQRQIKYVTTINLQSLSADNTHSPQALMTPIVFNKRSCQMVLDIPSKYSLVLCYVISKMKIMIKKNKNKTNKNKTKQNKTKHF